MRDIAVTLVIFAIIPFILWRPWLGVLAWSWLGYMNPHKLAWGFATTMPFALLIALATLGALAVSREPKRIPWTRETILLLVLIGWMFITTCFALVQAPAWEQWDKVWRVMLMTYVTMMLITDKHRVKMLMFVIALSLGFYGFKGGVFVLTGGSAHQVLGPPKTFIGERNSIGLALIMTVPLLYYMQLQMTRWYARYALFAGIGLTLVAIVGTHSRGALVGIAAMLLFFLLKSRKKFTAILAIIPLVYVMYSVMPEEWFERMQTIQTWQEDGSASERVRAWGNAIDLANERFIGGGMRALVYWGGRDSHSIYFGMLGEHGWVGLGMFLLLLFFTWRSGSWIISQTRGRNDLFWARDLASMVQVSLVGYMAAGAFLGLQYFDLFYQLMAIIVVTRVLLTKRFEEEERSGGAVGSLDPHHATNSKALGARLPRRGTPVLGASMTYLLGQLSPPEQTAELTADHKARCTERQLLVALQGLPLWRDRELATLAGHQGHAQALLEGYHRHGDEVLQRLHGGFAVAIHDVGNDSILLACDRSGIVPLFHAVSGDNLVFGTRANQVAAQPGVDGGLHPQALYDYLYFHVVPGPETIYAGVRRLQPGECLQWQAGIYALSLTG